MSWNMRQTPNSFRIGTPAGEVKRRSGPALPGDPRPSRDRHNEAPGVVGRAIDAEKLAALGGPLLPRSKPLARTRAVRPVLKKAQDKTSRDPSGLRRRRSPRTK